MRSFKICICSWQLIILMWSYVVDRMLRSNWLLSKYHISFQLVLLLLKCSSNSSLYHYCKFCGTWWAFHDTASVSDNDNHIQFNHVSNLRDSKKERNNRQTNGAADKWPREVSQRQTWNSSSCVLNCRFLNNFATSLVTPHGRHDKALQRPSLPAPTLPAITTRHARSLRSHFTSQRTPPCKRRRVANRFDTRVIVPGNAQFH